MTDRHTDLIMVGFLVLLALTSICVGFTGVGKRLSSSNVQSNENLKKEVKSEHSVHKVRVKCRMALSSGTGDSMNTENPYYVGMSAYEILGVKKGADKKVVKAAYRKLVSVWHPDKFPDNEDKKKEGGLRMERINRAYFCLEDDDRRRRYDLYGEKAVGTSASSEEKMKNNADAYFGGGSSSSSSSSSSNSGSNNRRTYSSGGQSDAYRVEDDPFVWGKFRREQEDKRRKYEEDRRSRDPDFDPEPQPQKSDDNSGQDWSDDWWKAGGSSSESDYDGPRRPAYGSSSYSDYDEDYADYGTNQDSVPFPNADSSYEDIMDFLQKTGGFGVPDSPSGGGGDFATKRMYDDDASVDSPQLHELRNKKGVLLQEQRDIQRRLGDDGIDWGEVTDADAIAQRLSDMSRVQTIDQEISLIDDEIEDAVMRIKAGERAGRVGDGFSQRAWGSAVGVDDSVGPFGGRGEGDDDVGASRGSGSFSDLWGSGEDEGPRRPRGVTARRRAGGAGAGNVYGRAPPSRDPPRTPPPPVAHKDSGGDDSDRKRPTMTSQGRAAKEENSLRQRRAPSRPSRPSRSAGAGGGQRRRDLYTEPEVEENTQGHESLLGSHGDEGEGEGEGEGEDMRQEEEGAGSGSWRRSYQKRRQGGREDGDAAADDGKTPDQRFLEEIERLQGKGPPKRGPRGPRR